MNLFKILERCRENAEKWEALKDQKSLSIVFRSVSEIAAQDWRALESEILASIDEEQEGMLKQQAKSGSLSIEALAEIKKFQKGEPRGL